ncbi:hypothetical protein Hanom_Chr09g00764141 [Helianthus anomalus]
MSSGDTVWMRQGSGEDVCRAANTAADKVWSRQKFKNGKGLPSRENNRERVVRERGGIVGGVHSYLNQSHLFPFFFLKIVYHFTKCLNHCQHFSPKFKHFCLIDMVRSHWSVFWFATLKCLTTPYTLSWFLGSNICWLNGMYGPMIIELVDCKVK